MSLTVKVLKHKGRPVERLSTSFHRGGVTLGRSSENHLVLPDPDKYISRKHAVINYEKGSYYLTDTSAAGTLITNKNEHVHHNSVQLADGDELRIGDYDLIVTIPSHEAIEASTSPAPSEGEDSSFINFDQDRGPTSEPGMGENIGGDKVFSRPEGGNFDHPSEPFHSIGNNYPSAINGSFPPIDVVTPTEDPSKIPDSIEDYLSEKSPRQSPEKVVSDLPEPIQQSPREAYGDLLKIFFEAAGIGDTSFLPKEDYPELMRTVGAVFRELVEGLMRILRGRTELKAQVRVSVTLLGPDKNNPLKFSPEVADALKLLFTKDHRGFLGAVDAVREGYQDIENHHLAMTAGVQASLMNQLKRFDPQKFAKRYEEGIVFQKKAKCWDAYSQAYRAIVKEALEDFFGEEFAQAYEAQMSKLRATRNKG